MNLRRQLITQIAIALGLAGVLTAVLGGLAMRHEVNELLDQELGQIARISSQVDSRANPHSIPGHDWRQGPRDGVVIVQRWFGDERISLVPTRIELPRPARAGYRDFKLGSHTWRSYALQTEDGWVVAAQPAEARHELMRGAYWMSVAPVLLGLPLAGVLVVLVIRRTLAPLNQLIRDLKRRPALSTLPLGVPDIPDEVGPLVDAFNELLHRVGTSVERERRFVTDAAHALRTPVTALLLQAQSLQEARSQFDATERLEDLVAGIARARRTVEQLLELARSEATPRGSASVGAAFRALSEEFQTVLTSQHIALELEVPAPEDAIVAIHPTVLQLALRSMLENAIRYSPRGRIRVGASTHSSICRLWITDEGPGLPADELERVFDRFYRPAFDTTSGTGLGLAIARNVVAGVSGRVWLENRSDRPGLTALIELPLLIPPRTHPEFAMRASDGRSSV